MLQELSDEISQIGLKMDNLKVKVIDITPISLDNVIIYDVEGYECLGATLQEPIQNDKSKTI